jgi:Glycosyltransferase 61
MRLAQLLRPRKERFETPPFEDISSHLSRFPGQWQVVHAPSQLQWPRPRNYGARTIEFALPGLSAEYGVLELQGGRVFGSHGWIVGRNGAVLPELSWYGSPSERIRIPRRLPEAIDLAGVCLSLVSEWSYRNYSHYLLDSLGRLALFLEGGFSLVGVDHVYCPPAPSAAAGRYLDAFGISSDKIIFAAPGRLVRADTLLIPSRPATELTYARWLARFLRAALVRPSNAPAGRRLYVSRGGYGREAVEERSVEALLREHGFEIYRPQEHADQPRDFAEAEMVVGPHGAGLANLAFCRTGTRVVEIVPTDNAHPFYYSLAVSAGLDYGYLAAQSVVDRDPATFGPSPYDFHVELEELRAAIA